MSEQPWTVRLSATAEADFKDILRWTVANFGDAQARGYAETLSRALQDLTTGPDLFGVKRREDIGPDLATLHVARKGRNGRHFVAFRISAASGQHFIDVLRLLHDRMDLPRHLGPETNTAPGEA